MQKNMESQPNQESGENMELKWWAAWNHQNGEAPQRITVEAPDSDQAYEKMTRRGEILTVKQIVYGPYPSQEAAEQADIPPMKTSA